MVDFTILSLFKSTAGPSSKRQCKTFPTVWIFCYLESRLITLLEIVPSLVFNGVQALKYHDVGRLVLASKKSVIIQAAIAGNRKYGKQCRASRPIAEEPVLLRLK